MSFLLPIILALTISTASSSATSTTPTALITGGDVTAVNEPAPDQPDEVPPPCQNIDRRGRCLDPQ
jgi:hypothetical protein